MKVTIELNSKEFKTALDAGVLEPIADLFTTPVPVEEIAAAVELPESTKVEKVEKAEVKKEPASEISIEDVRAAFMAKNSKGNAPKLKSILNDFGVKKVTDLKEEDFTKVLEVLEAV